MYQNQRTLHKSKSSILITSKFQTSEIQTQIYRTDAAKNLLTHNHSFHVPTSSSLIMNLSEIDPKRNSQVPTQNTKNKVASCDQIALQIQSIVQMKSQIQKGLAKVQQLDLRSLKLIFERLNERIIKTEIFLIQLESVVKNSSKILEASMDSDQNKRLQIEQNSNQKLKGSLLSEVGSYSHKVFVESQLVCQVDEVKTPKDMYQKKLPHLGTMVRYKTVSTNTPYKQKDLTRQIQKLNKQNQGVKQILQQLSKQNIVLRDKSTKSDCSSCSQHGLEQNKSNDINLGRLSLQRSSDKHINKIHSARQKSFTICQQIQIKHETGINEGNILAAQSIIQQTSSFQNSTLRLTSTNHNSREYNIQASDQNRYPSINSSLSQHNVIEDEIRIYRTVTTQQNVESSGQTSFRRRRTQLYRDHYEDETQ